MRSLRITPSLSRLVLALVTVLSVLAQRYETAAQPAEEPPKQKKQVPVAQFVTVTSPIDDVMFGRVTNAALKLQNQAETQKRQALLVLEITSGTSQFHQVYGLAKFLTSANLSKVTTVAWIPETVTGNNVVLALVCNEIIMHPDAELGDIGRGKALDRDEQQSVLALVEKRKNRKVNRALALAMMDPQQELMKIDTEQGVAGGQGAESQVATKEEVQRLVDNNVIVKNSRVIVEQGVVGKFSGSQARAHDILVVQTAESRRDVAELYNIPSEGLREDPTVGEAPRVRLIKIDDVIEPVLETFVERQIQRAIDSGANLLIFEIHSPGGYLLSSKNLAYAIADLDPKKVRTVAYVPQEAYSGAAIIALGCDEIYMHAHAQIGDAGPIEMRPGQPFERAPEKVLGPLREMMRELAERKGRPTAVAMAMADMGLKVYQVTHRETGRVWYMTEDQHLDKQDEWDKGPMVFESKEDSLLTVNGRRAHELKIAEPPVKDRDELKQRLGIAADVNLDRVAVGRTWIDTLIFTLNTPGAMFLLVVIGIVCIYLELHMMSGLLGIISALCFSLFFWSRFLGGTAGWLEVVLFLLGLVCIGLEVFVIPGFGVFGVSGGLLVLASLVLASQTFGNIEPDADMSMMSRTMGTLSLSIISVIVLAALMGRFLPRMPLLNQMILTPPGMIDSQHDEPRLRPEFSGDPAAGFEHDTPAVGMKGIAISTLRPAGKAQIGDHYVNVVSDGQYIAQGTEIEVVSVSGNRIVVRQA